MAGYNNPNYVKIKEMLAENELSFFEKKRYREYLDTMATFPTYSVNNQMLIRLQDPQATMVCGYNEWQEKHGRYVPKGTKCHIFIFAPCKRKREVKKKDDKGNYILDKNGDPVTEIKEWIDFKSTPVYDVSQTVGDPIASVSSLFSGRIDGYPEVIRIVSEASPSIVRFNDADTGYDKVNDCINIGSCLSQRDTLQALLPSVAAATMYKQSGQVYEYGSLEAESAAYVVASHFGVSADYDFDYIADWASGKDIVEMKKMMDVIRKASGQMIKNIERCRA